MCTVDSNAVRVRVRVKGSGLGKTSNEMRIQLTRKTHGKETHS